MWSQLATRRQMQRQLSLAVHAQAERATGQVALLLSKASLAMEQLARLPNDTRQGARRDALANVAHDLRNPLATIGAVLGRLEADRSLDAEQRDKLLRLALDSVDWMHHIIQDVAASLRGTAAIRA